MPSSYSLSVEQATCAATVDNLELLLTSNEEEEQPLGTKCERTPVALQLKEPRININVCPRKRFKSLVEKRHTVENA